MIDQNQFYVVLDETFICCGELQFRYMCKAHNERQGCMFCEFDPDSNCDA